ncbi:hypothetical protein G6L37_00350 [Agrobacterium rubi]|nr:hypothetical protein [Agrobacterium rubi]NTF23839.1 hypothetical protein [Agrobacterium rubi]
MDRSLFPKRPDDYFLIAITPVICRPIPGSCDQFVIAALCSANGEHRLVPADLEESVKKLYPVHSDGILVAIDIAFADLTEALNTPEFDFGAYIPAVSSVSLGTADLTEGSDLTQAGERWLSAMCSLHRPLTDVGSDSQSELETLRSRIATMEALAEHPDPGLWRFWNAKATELSAELEEAKQELRRLRPS